MTQSFEVYFITQKQALTVLFWANLVSDILFCTVLQVYDNICILTNIYLTLPNYFTYVFQIVNQLHNRWLTYGI